MKRATALYSTESATIPAPPPFEGLESEPRYLRK
jgi:hypothetical protein